MNISDLNISQVEALEYVSEYGEDQLHEVMENLEIQNVISDETKEESDEGLEEQNGNGADRVKTGDEVSKKRIKPPLIFRCEICQEELEDDSVVSEHLEKHDYQHFCETCGAKFKLTMDYIDHARDHNTNKLYKCTLCEFSVENRLKIVSHLRTKHDQFKKYRCKICNKGMNVYTHFLDHENVHTEKKPFECDKCDSSFPQRFALNAHVTRMHIQDPTQCDVCQKLCRNKSELRSHKISHNKMTATCPECGKTLSSKDKLRIHIRAHTGEKPYPCQYCGKLFKTSTFRSDHERTHTGEKPHICSICTKGFTQRTSMKIHELTHSEEKPFQCDKCGKQFKTKNSCKGHMKKCVVVSRFQPEDNVTSNLNSERDINVFNESEFSEQLSELPSQGFQDFNQGNFNEPQSSLQSYVQNYDPNVYNNHLSVPQGVDYSNLLSFGQQADNFGSFYVQLPMYDDQSESLQIGNLIQAQQIDYLQQVTPSGLEQQVNTTPVYHDSTANDR